jgi:hypothetical protein
MLHGVLPYIDVWDRKPIGLFLIFAAIRLLGGEGIIQYQIVATIFVAATALLIVRFATRFATAFGAIAVGILYIVWLSVFGGDGGQGPVFYNLFTTAAATLTYKTISLASSGRRRSLGCAAMLVVGLALQIKYSVVFEGIFFGLALLWANMRDRLPARIQLIDASLWIVCALLPTALVALVYAEMGELQPFVFANFISILERGTEPRTIVLGRLEFIGKRMLLLLAAALAAVFWLSPRLKPTAREAHRFAIGWAISAVLGFLVFGTYFDHYALPIVAPILLVAAPLLSQRLLGVAMTLALLFQGIRLAERTVSKNIRHRGDATTTARLLKDIRHHQRGCIFIINADPILYYLSGACFPTRYAFPTHLYNLREAPALGIDQVTEIARVLALRPSVIVTAGENGKHANPKIPVYLNRTLSQRYQLVDRVVLDRDDSRLVYVARVSN